MYDSLLSSAPYSPDAASAGRRALRNAVLDLFAAGNPDDGATLAAEQFDAARQHDGPVRRARGAGPHPRRGARTGALPTSPLIMPTIRSCSTNGSRLQASIPEAATLDRIKGLMQHPAFSLSNPNRTRALIGSFAMGNLSQFNRADGAGYAFLADIVLQLDGTNPQVAARLLGAFRTLAIARTRPPCESRG